MNSFLDFINLAYPHEYWINTVFHLAVCYTIFVLIFEYILSPFCLCFLSTCLSLLVPCVRIIEVSGHLRIPFVFPLNSYLCSSMVHFSRYRQSTKWYQPTDKSTIELVYTQLKQKVAPVMDSPAYWVGL